MIYSKSWYDPEIILTKREAFYINTITTFFNMKTPKGEKTPYVPTKYQVDFHRSSLNILEEKAKDILFIKARGISFTYCSCIELIMTALLYKDQMIPIIAQRQQSAIDILEICKWFLRNANVDFSNEVEISKTQITFLKTNSTIRPFPSNSASDALRSSRVIRGLVDELAFQKNGKELLAAVQDTMVGKLGQMLYGSTPAGRNNIFFELIQNPVGFKVFRLPVFDETKFDVRKSIFSQKHLLPIAPWIDLEKLEDKRRRDIEIFKQEQLCDFCDDSISFLSYSLIKSCEDENLKNYHEEIEKNPDFSFSTENPLYMGVDVGRTNDFTSIVIYEKIYSVDEDKFTYVQRYLHNLQNKPLPEQKNFLDRLFRAFPQIVKCRMDMGGIGLGLFEYARLHHGSKVEGILFQTRVRTGMKESVGIKERMAVNMKTKMQDDEMFLVLDDMQVKHLNSVDYDFTAPRKKETGHADIFWANALALLPENFRAPQLNKITGKHTTPFEVPHNFKQENIEWKS